MPGSFDTIAKKNKNTDFLESDPLMQKNRREADNYRGTSYGRGGVVDSPDCGRPSLPDRERQYGDSGHISRRQLRSRGVRANPE